jgi:actin-related protein
MQDLIIISKSSITPDRSMSLPGIVIDSGSGYTKAGLTSDDYESPSTIFQTVIAKPNGILTGMSNRFG